MLKVGLSACFMYPDLNRLVFGAKSLTYMENDMVRYLSDQGTMPILIPDVSDEKLDQYLDEVKGLVLQGGVDVSPISYGEEGIENNRWPGDPYRDQYELKLIEKAMQRGMPILGICRGFQLLNVYFGGTLFQDLLTQTQTEVVHRDAIEYDHINHGVHLEKDSILAKVYGKTELQVNSVHHQGIKSLAKDLIAEAVSSSDQLIEAFRYHDMKKHFVWGVQWHPEFNHTLGDKIDPADPIIKTFLQELRK